MADSFIFEAFPTVQAFMGAVTSRPQNNNTPNERGKNGNNDFAGGLTWEQSLEALEKGLPDVCNDLKTELKRFNSTGSVDVGTKSRPRNYYYGSKPNVAAAMAGKPKSMRQRKREPIKVKTVRIIYDSCQNARVKADTLHKSGVTVLCLVYALEKAGYRVKFDLLPFTSRESDHYAISLINLKDFKQPLDLLKISFPITHPAMFRRFGFTWLETVEGLGTYYDGHGRHIGRDDLISKLSEAKVLDGSAYVIQIDDCQKAEFDVKTLALNLGISL